MAFSLSPFFADAQTDETPFASVEVPLDMQIPDGAGELSNTITLPGSGLLEELEIALTIEHAAVEQLIITLTGPDGLVILRNRAAAQTNPYSPVYPTIDMPAESLGRFIGKNAKGDWTLTIQDTLAGVSGRLLGWGIRFRPISIIESMPPTPVPIPANAQFNQVDKITLDLEVSSVHCDDINNNGLDDVALLSEMDNRILLYFSNGSSLTSPPSTLEVEKPKLVQAADLDNDQSLDIVVASQGPVESSTIITVFSVNNAGGYSAGFSAQLLTGLQTMLIEDMDEDGVLDIVIGGSPIILTGVGDGSFDPPQTFVFRASEFLDHGDINQDGFTDFFLKVLRGGTSPNRDPFVLLHKQNTDFPYTQDDGRKFEIAGTFLQGFSAATKIPSRQDFVALSVSGEVDPVQYFTVIQSDGDRFLSMEETRLAANTLIPPVQAFDSNADGLDELLFINDQGIASFQKSPNVSGNQSKVVLANADLKRFNIGMMFSDGRVGLAAVNKNNELILAKTNQGARKEPPFFQTATTSPTPFLFVTATSIPPSPTPVITPTPPFELENSPDLNNDGIVNHFDLLILKQFWGKEIQP